MRLLVVFGLSVLVLAVSLIYGSRPVSADYCYGYSNPAQAYSCHFNYGGVDTLQYPVLASVVSAQKALIKADFIDEHYYPQWNAYYSNFYYWCKTHKSGDKRSDCYGFEDDNNLLDWRVRFGTGNADPEPNMEDWVEMLLEDEAAVEQLAIDLYATLTLDDKLCLLAGDCVFGIEAQGEMPEDDCLPFPLIYYLVGIMGHDPELQTQPDMDPTALEWMRVVNVCGSSEALLGFMRGAYPGFEARFSDVWTFDWQISGGEGHLEVKSWFYRN